jgi:hypothetical protein
MRFGIFGSAQANSADLGPETGQGFRDYLDYCVEAEALGFHSSFLVEHHFTGWNQVSATLMLQACLAMQTRTLRLGSAVIVLPWHNPVLLAEQAATLDLGFEEPRGIGRRAERVPRCYGGREVAAAELESGDEARRARGTEALRSHELGRGQPKQRGKAAPLTEQPAGELGGVLTACAGAEQHGQ